MAEDQLTLETFPATRPGETVIALTGFLKAETAFRLRDAARQIDDATLVLDMTHVKSIDSSGLGVLIGLYVSCERQCRRLLLAGVNDRIWELFRTCKVEDVFTRYPTVGDAEQTVSA